MAQLREATRATVEGSRDWLTSLVTTLDQTALLSEVPCDARAMRAMRVRLARLTTTRPVSPRFSRTSTSYSPASCNRGS